MNDSLLQGLLTQAPERCVVVAEISANHSGSLSHAVELVHLASAAGASAVKLQTYSADSITLKADAEAFRIPADSPWSEYGTLWSLYAEGATPREWHAELFSAGVEASVPVFSSPFSASDVDFLESLDCPAYKIASPEIGYVQLLDAVAQTGKPVMLSTGVALAEDVESAVLRLRRWHSDDITILKCTSCYPAPEAEQNLATMTDIARRWDVRVGFSDHTTSTVSGAVAVALGAQVIEKHFRGDSEQGLDGFFSLNSSEFQQYVEAVREAEMLRGSVDYSIAPCAQDSRRAMRSLYFTKSLPAGHILAEGDLAIVRPSGGLPPDHLTAVVGCELSVEVTAGTPVKSHFLKCDAF